MYDARTRFLADAVATAGPAKLLTMLYDRLLLDLERAEVALRAGDRATGTQQLAHAQEIVAEFIANLNVGEWDGGDRLLSVYTYLLSEMIGASMAGDADRAAACRGLVAPLADAWHEAAQTVANDVPTQRRAPAFDTAETGTGVLGVG
ncbi:flagellar export chaperone FliS [Cellulosimicrobium cellulans]|uniref:flagellar export chaperone FliS n=1 Tax=Cellulosimicrobium cellulans TaxID=1710 RepID=UPI00130EA150|nr:flagellar export chaperone FliS [Cellulosimicrobium cellulans]